MESMFDMKENGFFSKILDHIHRICAVLSGACLVFIATLMFLSVLFRYVLVAPIVWYEEITGFFLVWMVLLGAPVGYRSKEHVAIDFLSRKVPHSILPYLQLIHSFIILWVAAIIVLYGIPHTWKSMNQIFPTVEWIRYGYMYVALPIGYFLLGLYCLEDILRILRAFRKKED